MLALSLVASVLLAGAPGGEPLEILVQRGHGGKLRSCAPLGTPDELVTTDGEDARFWAPGAGIGHGWLLARVIRNSSYVWFGKQEYAGEFVVEGAPASQLFRRGRFEAPLIEGLPPRISEWMELGPGVPHGWRLQLFRDEGDSNRDGLTDEYHLFFSADGEHYARAPMQEQLGGVADALQIGDREIALKEARRPGLWRFFRYEGDGWREVTLPGAPASVTVLREVSSQQGIFVSTGGAEGVYLYRDARGAWGPLASVIPQAPRDIAEVLAAGERQLVGVLSRSDERWHWFVRQGEAFIELALAVGEAGSLLENVRGLAAGRVVAFQPEQDGGPGRFRHFAQTPDGAWQPLEKVLPDAPERILDAVSFAAGKGLGVQAAVASSGLKAFEWRWYVLDAGGRWQRLDQLVRGFPAHVIEVKSPDPDHLVGAKVEAASAAEESSWVWFLRAEAGPWLELQGALGATLKPERVELDTASGLVRAYSASGELRCFRRDLDGTWTDIASKVLFPARSAGIGREVKVPRASSVQFLASGDVVRVRAATAPERTLARDREGWSELPAGPAGALRADEESELLTSGANTGAPSRFLARDERDRFSPLEDVLPAGAGPARDAYSFLGPNGVAVEGPSGWTFWLKEAQRWRALTEVLPRAPPKLQRVVGLGSAGLALQESGDFAKRGRLNEWWYYFRKGEGWAELHELVSGLPPFLWEVSAFAGDDGLALMLSGQSGEKSWRYLLRDGAGRFKPAAEVLTGCREPLRDLRSGGSDLFAVRCGEGEGFQFFLRTRAGFAALTLPVAFDRLFKLEGDASTGFVALRGVSKGRTEDWRVFVAAENGAAQELSRALTGAPPFAAEVKFFPEERLVALQVAPSGRAPQWRWFSAQRGQLPTERRPTAAPVYTGLSSKALGDGSISLAGAIHTVDGAPSPSVPMPSLWVSRTQPELAAGPALRLAEWVPEGLQWVGAGPRGLVLIYPSEGSLQAASFTHGEVALDERELHGAGGTTRLSVIINRFADGTGRIHRASDPTRWISYFEDSRSGGRVYFDDCGYFYAERGGLAETLSFRNGARIYTFGQLEAYLFRPDRLEERLGLAEGSLFPLTALDRQSIARARELGRSLKSLADLKPPRIRMEAVARQVSDPDLAIPFTVEPGADRNLTVSVTVLGAGQARGLKARDQHTVRLLEGDNTVEVEAVDGANLSATERVQVRYVPKTAARRTLWVAIVAAREYGALPKLPMTQRDARDMASTFLAQKGAFYDEVHVHTWCDGLPGEGAAPPLSCDDKPDLESIRRGVPSFFSAMKDGDAAFLYVSGHGLGRDGRFYFVPEDGVPTVATSLVEWSDLKGLVSSARTVGKRVLLIDACQSGAVGGDSGNQSRLVQETAEREGIYVLTASAATESAFELGELGNGIFTHVLKRGLAGGADVAPEDTRVTFFELASWVGEQVRVEARRRGLVQQPFRPILDEWMDFSVASARHSRVQLAVIGADGDINAPERVREWEQRLVAAVPGLELVKPGEPGLRVSIVEGAKGLVVLTVKSADGKPVVDRRSLHFSKVATEVQRLVGARAPGEGTR